MKKILFLLITLLFFFGCSTQKKDQTPSKEVVTSTFALYDIASHLAPKTLHVRCLLSPGMEVHTFEPTPKDIIALKKSALFIYNGAGLEPWVEQFAHGIKSLDVSRFVTLKKIQQKVDDPHHHHQSHHHHEGVDPHYWLDLSNMQKATKAIAEALIEIMPEQKEVILSNEKNYIHQLQALDEAFQEGLKSCQKNTIYVNHNAYSYLASRYHFYVESLVGLSSEAKPSAKMVQEILEEIKKDHIKVIFGESFENNRVVEMIAKDADVAFEVLQPLANITKEDAKKGLDFDALMRQNLTKLSKALECQ